MFLDAYDHQKYGEDLYTARSKDFLHSPPSAPYSGYTVPPARSMVDAYHMKTDSGAYVPPSGAYVPSSGAYVPPSGAYVPPPGAYVPPSTFQSAPSTFKSADATFKSPPSTFQSGPSTFANQMYDETPLYSETRTYSETPDFMKTSDYKLSAFEAPNYDSEPLSTPISTDTELQVTCLLAQSHKLTYLFVQSHKRTPCLLAQSHTLPCSIQTINSFMYT